MSFLRQATITPADARAAEYVLAFGPPVDVHVNGGVDVFVHGPRRATPSFSTLVTSGMSDLRLSSGGVERAELVLYARRPTVDHAALLRRLAALAGRSAASFGLYNVVLLGDRSFLLAPPPVEERVESPFSEPLVFLWPIELTPSETVLLAEHGHRELMDRLYGEPGGPPSCLLVDEPRRPVA